MARVAWFFPVPEEAELPERLQGLFAKARETLGFVPNVFRAYSYRPERLSAWFGHYKQLHEPTEHLDEADREMIAVVVSAWNRCTYCVVVARRTRCATALGRPASWPTTSPPTGGTPGWTRAAPRSAPTPRSSPPVRTR